MSIDKLLFVAAVMVLQLLALVAAEPAMYSAAGNGRGMASKLGIRRALQDDNCIPQLQVCCANCGWPFERTNCCDPDNFACSYNPVMDPAHALDWCMPRNPDDIPKYYPELFPPSSP